MLRIFIRLIKSYGTKFLKDVVAFRDSFCRFHLVNNSVYFIIHFTIAFSIIIDIEVHRSGDTVGPIATMAVTSNDPLFYV